MIATEAMIERITGKKRPSAQARQLKRQRIPFRLNSLKQPLVLESDIQQWIGANSTEKDGPNWSAMRGSHAHQSA